MGGQMFRVMFCWLRYFFDEKFPQNEKRGTFDQQKHSIGFEISKF